MIRILPNDAAQAEVVCELFGILAQMQNHIRAAFRTGRRFDTEIRLAGGTPADRFILAEIRTPGHHADRIGHDERAVEANAELADQHGILRLVAGQAGQELGRSRPGDGAQVVDDLVATHADAVVRHRQRARFGIEADPHAKLWIVGQQFGLFERFETQFVYRI